MDNTQRGKTGAGDAWRNESIRDYENRVKHYYRVWFSDGREATAKLICDTHRFPIGKTSVETYSRLFPMSESRKMKRLILGCRYPSIEQAYENI